jgi:hypothetical protein
VVLSACGQKGPPLAPIVYLPRPVTEVVAKRVEDEVVLQFTVPTVNTDGSGPADLGKIEVYAHTGPLPAPADFLKYGTLVASVEIKQPPEPQDKSDSAEATDGKSAAGTPPDTKVEPPSEEPSKPGLVEQGSKTSVRETLTPKHLEIGPMPPARPLPPPDPKAPVVVLEKIETPGTVNFDLTPQRFYAIFPISESRNRRGPVFGPMPVMLIDPLSPPETLKVDYAADAISLTWPGQPEDLVVPGATPATGPSTQAQSATPEPTPPAVEVDRETEGTVELFADLETAGTADVLVAPAADKIATGAKPKPRPPLKQPSPPTPRFGYNVYEAGTTGLSDEARTANIPVAPLNTALLTAPGFSDPRVEFGAERCYVVRRVEMAGTVAIESAPSRPVCVTPVDTFPPAPPKSLAHIAAGNGVSLLWEANTESDLGGYLVLRGEAPGDKLSPLTKAPITDTSFLDSTVRRGRTYVYEVVAVDRSTPPNQSAPSNRVEETIR